MKRESLTKKFNRRADPCPRLLSLGHRSPIIYNRYLPIIAPFIVVILIGCHSPEQQDRWITKEAMAVLSAVCEHSPLLKQYHRAGYITAIEPSLIKVELNADLHQYDDCGAPDCYGTHVTIYLHVVVDENTCRVQAAQVKMENFFDCGTTFGPTPEDLIAPEESYYRIKPPHPNLNDPNIEGIELQSIQGTERVLLERNNFYLENGFNSAVSFRLRRMQYEQETTGSNIILLADQAIDGRSLQEVAGHH